jgi:protein O-mannosyl-transferase
VNRRLILSILLALLAGLAYLNALHNPFVYDDLATVISNPSLRTPGNVQGLLHQTAFRPVTNLSYALDYAIWGLRPFGFHVTSVVWHMLNVALLFWIAVVATEDWRRRDPERAGPISPEAVGFAAAALLAVHPMMTQAVGYVSGRPEILCAVFVMLALLSMRAALVHDRPIWILPGLIAAALAVGSKEIGIMFPFVLVVWDRLLLAPSTGPDGRRLRWLPLTLMGLAVGVGIARLAAFLWIEPPSLIPHVPYVMAQFRGLWRYVLLMVVPLSQSLVHPIEARATVDVVTVLGALALGALVVLITIGRRREPLMTLGIAWFLLLLLPSSVVPLPEVIAEHRVYLGSSGLFLAAGAGWGGFLAWLPDHPRRWRVEAAAAFGVVIAMLLVLTVARNIVWADPVRLWRDAAHKAPGSWAAHFGVGSALAEAGNCHDAIPAFREALRLAPRAQIFMNLGTCLVAEEKFDDAVRAYEGALAVEPGYVPARFNLALLALHAGDLATAQRYFLQSITADPRDRRWRELLLLTYLSKVEDPALRLEMCRAIHGVAPDTTGLAECLRNEGRNRPD